MFLINLMDDQISGSNYQFISLQILNFIIFSLGIALLVISFIIWEEVKSFNSFIFTIIFVSFVIVCSNIIGYGVRYSPTKLIIYFVLVFIVTVGLTILLFFVIYDKDQIVAFLTQNMKDSPIAIKIVKEYLDQNIDLIKILLLSYSTILVINYLIKIILLVLTLYYRKSLKENISYSQNRLLQ